MVVVGGHEDQSLLLWVLIEEFNLSYHKKESPSFTIQVAGRIIVTQVHVVDRIPVLALWIQDSTFLHGFCKDSISRDSNV